MQLKKYNHPFLFYGVAFIVPWLCWFILAWLSNSQLWDNPTVVFWGSILGLIGLFGPFVIAMVLILPDKEMRQELLSAVFNFKGIRPIFWILTFVLFPISILVAQVISLPFGHSVSQFKFVENMSFSAGIFPAWFLLIIAPILEEFGWHTYGIHCLRNRLNLLMTCVIFGIAWGIWHMPLSFVKGYYQNVLVETGIIYSINFLASLIPYLIIGNWIYYKTNRNMFLVVVFHLLAGFSNEIFQTHPDSKVIQTVLLLIFSIIIICKEKAFFFNKSHEVIL
ncbi:MAG: CPBP family intramembrane metalloprotease [Fibromonadaceae bacterium]|jgi:membrane protease YdiL (CAAX protease family)|nr:CPBP family intramembrane metalloprotease [Fibromonadaceae bacterium]